MKGNKGSAAHAASGSGRDTFSGAFVLPRFLRRPVRFGMALATGRVGIRPHRARLPRSPFSPLPAFTEWRWVVTPRL
jgi:hypothetical protein